MIKIKEQQTSESKELKEVIKMLRKTTIALLVAGIILSVAEQSYGNWLTRLLGIERPRTEQPAPTKGDMRRTR